MGKQKNRLTATKPQNHFARIFSKWPPACRARRDESGGGGLDAVGGLWAEAGVFEVGV
jgi:hypothetical protein